MMEGHRFLVCCVLVLTICKLGGAAEKPFVDYTFDPVTKPKKDEKTDVSIKFFVRVPTKLFNKESVRMVFTVKSLNHQALNILTSDIIVPESNVSVKTNQDGFTTYSGEFEVQVSVTAHTDGVTGDLSVKLSCDDLTLCEGNDKIEVIVKETKTLHVTATPSYVVSQTSPTTDVTVTLSKDLATLEDITISVSLHDPQGQHHSYQSVLASDADSSSFPVVFTNNIQWGEYQLIIGCGDDSVCSALSQWIQFPEPVSVPAHPSHSELGATIFGLKKQLTDYAANYTTLKDEYVTLKANYDTHTLKDMVSVLRKELRKELTDKIEALHSDSDSTKVNLDLTLTLNTAIDELATVPTPSSTTTDDVTAPTSPVPTEAPQATNSSSPSPTPLPTTTAPAATTVTTPSTAPATTTPSTRYMEFAVGGLIAALVCGLLGYLLYHYRTKVKEWICSKKVVVSNLPIARKLRRNAGSRYSKLPRTMQEALHQD